MTRNNAEFQNSVVPVHRGLANFIPGRSDNGPDKSTFEINDENEKVRVERGDKPQGLGIHWSSDPKVAKNFALNDQGFPTPKIAGIVYHGQVDSRHIWSYNEPGSVDYHDLHQIYHPNSRENQDNYGEKEVTVKEGKPVQIHGMDVYHTHPLWKTPVRLSMEFETPFRAKA